MAELRDCEYGDYKDMNNDVAWWDDFFPRNDARKAASVKFNEAIRETLDDIAYENGLNTDGWEEHDYDMFREAMDL